MVKKICDRCGKAIPIASPISNAFTNTECYPMFMINVRANSWSVIRSIDLCHNCSVSLMNFINTTPEATNEEEDDGAQ